MGLYRNCEKAPIDERGVGVRLSYWNQKAKVHDARIGARIDYLSTTRHLQVGFGDFFGLCNPSFCPTEASAVGQRSWCDSRPWRPFFSLGQFDFTRSHTWTLSDVVVNEKFKQLLLPIILDGGASAGFGSLLLLIGRSDQHLGKHLCKTPVD